MADTLNEHLNAQPIDIHHSGEFIVLASLIPGLGLALLGRRQMAAVSVLTMVVSLGLIMFRPSLGGAAVLSFFYFAQMLWAGSIAIIQEFVPTKVLPPGLPHDDHAIVNTPMWLQEETVLACFSYYDSFQRTTLEAVLTPVYLILAYTSLYSNTPPVERILLTKISWVTIEIWRDHLLMMIEFEQSEHQPIMITLPLEAETQAKTFLLHLTGSIEYKVPFTETIEVTHPTEIRPAYLALLFAALALVSIGAYLTVFTPTSYGVWLLAIGIFLVPWARLVWVLRMLHHGIQDRSVLRLSSVLSAVQVLTAWWILVTLISLSITR